MVGTSDQSTNDMGAALFPDMTVIVNFAAINELDLLGRYLHDDGRIVEAVRHEIVRSAERVPNLMRLDLDAWFGDAISFDSDADIAAIDGLRIGAFGGSSAEPLKHLCESQTVHAVTTRSAFADATWITDDRDAYTYARSRTIVTRDTLDVFEVLVANSELAPDRAYTLSMDMLDAGRSLRRVPTSPRHF